MRSQPDPVPVQIRRAEPDEGEQLRTSAVASKGQWGYDIQRVREWAAGGDFSPAALSGKEVYVAEVGGRIVGWSALIPKGESCWLDDLWIEPDWIGRGIGSRLFRHAADQASRLGALT